MSYFARVRWALHFADGLFAGVHALYREWPGNPGSDGASPYHPFDALSLAQSRP
jgi:hypothetical protein